MRISVGTDVAKETHWVVALTEPGEVLLDHAVDNDPAAIEALIAELGALPGECAIGLDVLGGIATLLSAMLLAAGQRVVHVPGLAVNRARQGTTGGETKSDPRDARVIAEQVRSRRDLRSIAVEEEPLAELQLLVGRRRDLVAEQTRRLARLLAAKADSQLLGKTEFEVRDAVHRLGVRTLETALDERKKGATKAPV